MNSTFYPFSSFISAGFWQKLSNIILDGSEQPERIPIWGYYGPPTPGIDIAMMCVDHSSFDVKPSPSFNQVVVRGSIIFTKSLQEFKDLDKNALLAEFKLDTEKIEDNPCCLVPFVLLTYADLKEYVFNFWFGFPAVSSIKIEYSSPEPLHDDVLGVLRKGELYQDVWKEGFFILDTEKCKIKKIKLGGVGYYGFLDPSASPEIPSWVIRNAVAYITKKRELKSGDELKLISFRPKKGKDYVGNSCMFKVKIQIESEWISNLKVLGWERNEENKIAPKVVDLKRSMDPKMLSAESVDFNLKLMKWNLFPDFDLNKMHELKVCILGAGTLGCNVARCLMGWGVRCIDIVDYGKVSYSNPVRQSLYNYKDSSKHKAEAAALRLSEIFPGVKAFGHKLHIPMPGHTVSPSTLERTKADYNALVKLIESNDVIYLLTDTRESRWAPSVISAANNKLVINAALGFDSYLVMRHGMAGENLGCYFCTDVVAPGDSTKDRTLDQQCTVSRPGLSMIASGFAVELMVSALQQSSTLGASPHSMRGFLATGQFISPTFQNFDKCSACSKQVIDEFKKEGFEFIRHVMDDPLYLEKISGLDSLMSGVDGIVELDDETSD